MKNILTIFLFICFLLQAPLIIKAQDDTLSGNPKETVKTGWGILPLPVIGYDADMGFQYGVLSNFDYYGDGSKYPDYLHKFYVEVSRFTKGSGVNQFFYDSKYLIPRNIRITVDLSYLTEKALDFYGFNGYEAAYWADVTDDESEEYISRVYYKHERKLLRVCADLQGPIRSNKIRWLAGINFFDINTGTVDISKLNKGKSEDKKLPDTTLLYDEYVMQGVIGDGEKNGGTATCLKLGLVFDTRDNEPAPNRGIWSEVMLINAFGFLGSTSFTKLAVTHRQYISLVKRKLVFAYRLGYQGFLSKDPPFYMLPYMFYSYSLTTKPDGLGGAQNMRGILRNRVVGNGMAYGNIEVRWTIYRTLLFKQNFYIGLTGFLDGGTTVQEKPVDRTLFGDRQEFFFDQQHDNMHMSGGAGLRLAFNENAIITVDYGFAFDRRDGASGLYIGVSNIF